MKRICPIIHCHQQISPDLAMCRDHWRLVPAMLQNALVSAWKVYAKWSALAGADPSDENFKNLLDARNLHSRAMKAAIETVNGRAA